MSRDKDDSLDKLFGTSTPETIAPDDESEEVSKAVALAYDSSDKDNAPTVAASGVGALAQRIVEEAIASGVQVHKDADLVEILAATEVGDEIPVEAFVAVAEILRYVYEANGQKIPAGNTPNQG